MGFRTQINRGRRCSPCPAVFISIPEVVYRVSSSLCAGISYGWSELLAVVMSVLVLVCAQKRGNELKPCSGWGKRGLGQRDIHY